MNASPGYMLLAAVALCVSACGGRSGDAQGPTLQNGRSSDGGGVQPKTGAGSADAGGSRILRQEDTTRDRTVPATRNQSNRGVPEARSESQGNRSVEGNAGFVFVDGRCMDAPYRVGTEEGWLVVNGLRVRKICGWPIEVDPPEKPQIPAELLKSAASFDDLVLKDKNDAWHARMFRWIGRNVRDPQQRKVEVVRFYESLPFVKEATLPDDGTVVVKLKNGSEQVFGLDMPPAEPAPTKEDVAKSIRMEADSLIERLNKGDTYLFFTNGLELSFGRMKTAKDLNLMVEVLSSDRKENEKLDILRRMAILPEGDDRMVSSLVTGFRVSGQTARRIEELLRTSGITPRTLSDIPAVSPAEAERRAAESAK